MSAQLLALLPLAHAGYAARGCNKEVLGVDPVCVPGREGPWGQQAGKLRVQELDWGNEAHIIQADGPFAFVLAADCVYHEEHIFGLRQTVLALTDLKSTGQHFDL